METTKFSLYNREISENFNTLVIMRLTTRLCHSKGLVECEDRNEVGIKPYEKVVKRVTVPANARLLRVDVEEREKGYGTEAINLILDYGFNYLNLNNIKLDVVEFNERAIACYKKCGFKECGRRRKCEFIDGNYYDRISMDILKEEFTDKYILNRNI